MSVYLGLLWSLGQRLLVCLPNYHSASQLFANIHVPAFRAVIRNLVEDLRSLRKIEQEKVIASPDSERYVWKTSDSPVPTIGIVVTAVLVVVVVAIWTVVTW